MAIITVEKKKTKLNSVFLVIRNDDKLRLGSTAQTWRKFERNRKFRCPRRTRKLWLC